MDNIFFACPECQEQLKLPSGFAKPGERITCPKCNKNIYTPHENIESLREAPTKFRQKAVKPPEKQAEDNNIYFNCPECESLLKLPPGLADPGDIITCPKCDKDVNIPLNLKKDPQRVPTLIRRKIEKGPEQTADKAPVKSTRISQKIKLTAAICLPILLITAVIATRLCIVHRYKTKINKVITSLSFLGKITYDSIHISPFGREINIENILIKRPDAQRAIIISYLRLDNYDTRNRIPHHLSIRAYGIHLPLYHETIGKSGPALKALEYHCITAQMSCSYDYDKETKDLIIPELTIKSPNVADMKLALTMSDIDLDSETMNFSTLKSYYPGWQVKQGRLNYIDDNFIRKFLNYQADDIGETRGELQQGMLTDIDKEIAAEKDPFTKNSLIEFKKFLKNSQYLTIKANPDFPISIADIQDAYDEHGIKGLIPSLKLIFSIDNG